MIYRKSLSYLLLGLLTLQLSFTSVGSAQEVVLPSDVMGVQAESKSGKIQLTWDTAIDQDGLILGYRVYYGTESVQDASARYDQSVYTASVRPTYTFEGLPQGVPHYFAVTAVDDDGNESAQYSSEVMATLQKSQNSDFAVISAHNTEANHVVVQMSGAVSLLSPYNAFLIEDIDTEEEIFIGSYLTKGDEVYLIVEDDRFSSGRRYRVTASSSVVNSQGQPIQSGITDSAEFVAGQFSVLVTETPEEPEEPVTNAAPEPKVVEETREEEKKEEEKKETETKEEKVETTKQPIENTVWEETTDTTVPSDVSDLTYDLSSLALKKEAKLSWTPNTVDTDIAAQKIYVKENKEEDWQLLESLGTYASSFDLSVKKDYFYDVKVTTVDMAGNESYGATTNFRAYLEKVGPESLSLWMIIVAVLGWKYLGNRAVN